MTYSIVARDPETGELGVAVQSHWFSVGSVVSWAVAGVGAVATQALADPSYGPLGLELMRAGRSAEDTLTALLAGDSGAGRRQIGFVDGQGGAAAHTGPGCIAEAGHYVGHGFTTQANLMAHSTVWGAMADAYGSAEGDLTSRLLTALDAAQAEGGDIRGRQSAALLVVTGSPTGRPWDDTVFDIRVEDHPDPLVELHRLVDLGRAYHRMTAGDDAMGANDLFSALDHYRAAETMAPQVAEIPFWKAMTLAGNGLVEDALPVFAQVFAAEPLWREVVPRVVASGVIELDDDTVALILR